MNGETIWRKEVNTKYQGTEVILGFRQTVMGSVCG
jgi:hypothetical protein